MNISFQKMFFAIATCFALFAILILAKPILIPICFALLMSFILYPMARRIELWGLNRMFAVLITIILVILVLSGIIYLFSTQIVTITREFSDFQVKILKIFAEATLFVNNHMGFMPHLEKGDLMDQLKNWLNKSSGSLVQQTFSGTASFMAGLLATVIFTFLILIYRKGFRQAIIRSYSPENREKASVMLNSVQQVGQKYLVGVISIIIVLGLINSIGLLIIGIDNPFFFGYLAAILAIIPYIGTIVGALIPILYAVMTYDSLWTPLAVTIMFWAVQVVESNFLSPKIVGGSLKVNALAAIICIIVGASVWGVAGMILFLPLTAMVKVICEEYEELQPIALLIGEQNTNENKLDKEILDKLKVKIKKLASK
jgi:predicted PurR-regulated permease PerM